MRVRITRRIGQNASGTELDLTDAEAQWLTDRGYAEGVSNADDESDNGPVAKGAKR